MIVPKYVVDENIVNSEIKELNNILNQQRQLKKTLLLYLEKISEGIYNSLNPQDINRIHSFLEEVQKCFDKLKENIANIIELKSSLETTILNDSYDEFDFAAYNSKSTKLFEKINNDNNTYYAFMDSLFEFINVTFPEVSVEDKVEQKEISDIYTAQISAQTETEETSNDKTVEITEEAIIPESENTNEKVSYAETESIESGIIEPEITEEEAPIVEEIIKEVISEEPIVAAEELPVQEAEKSEENKSEEEKEEIKNEPEKVPEEPVEEPALDEENVLYISYKNEYARLPYSTEDIERIFSESPEKYSSIKDIIDKEYTVSLKNYKINSSSVYDECYNIAKNIEGYNSLKAIKYASSIKRVANANPLVIRACKNIENIDLYIKCLSENKLEDFKLFKIIEEK